jgi:hypothetical protein
MAEFCGRSAAHVSTHAGHGSNKNAEHPGIAANHQEFKAWDDGFFLNNLL